jgi:hypothetical protein
MNAQQSAFGELLTDIAKALREMSDDEFDQFVNGELRTSISFKREEKSGSRRAKSGLEISDDDLDSAKARLRSAETREEGYHVLQEAFSGKAQLFAFARFLDLPVQKRDSADKIRDKIVTSTVGRRLGGAAIRGGYSAQ